MSEFSAIRAIESAIPVNDLRRALEEQADGLSKVIAEVMASGWLVHGPQHATFEYELASYLGVNSVVGVANGTDALELAIRAAATPGRSTVVTVANAGGFASLAARRTGFDLRFCDVDPMTHCLDVESLRSVIDDDVAVVVVTHLYGRMASVEESRAVAEVWGASVVEDCAQAIGAVDGNRMAGSVGHAAAFSFYPTKNLGALGDGGAVATSDPELADRVRRLRQYGWSEKYLTSEWGGRNSRLDELQAAVLRYRLPELSQWNHRRRAIIGAYTDAASDRLRVLPALDASHVAHLAVVETDDAHGLRAWLGKRSIGTAVHYPVPDHRQPGLGVDSASRQAPDLSVTEGLCRRVVTVPCFPELTNSEVERICDGLRSF